jgi:hypothetical protein
MPAFQNNWVGVGVGVGVTVGHYSPPKEILVFPPQRMRLEEQDDEMAYDE